MVNLILPLFLVILKQKFAESIYCFECNAHWESCAEPPNYSQIQKNRVACAGSCVIFYNQNDGNTLYRACSDGLEAIEKRGGQTGVFTGSDNNLYYLCNTNDCNGGKSPVPQPPTFITASLTSYAIVTSSTKASTKTIIDCGLVPCNWQNGFVNSECKCQCYENYFGPECEFIIDFCYDNAECSSYNLTPQDCASQFTQNSCPRTCSAQCLGLTTTTTSTSTTSTTTTNPPCYDNAECSSYNLTPQDCASQFTQNSCPKTCSAQCLGLSTSTTSSTTTTTSTSTTSTTTTNSPCYDNAECSSYNLTPQDCASQFTQNSCPKTCSAQCLGISTSTTSTTTTTTSTSTTSSTTTTTSTSTIATTADCYDNAECSSYNLTPQDCASQFTQNSCPKSCSAQCLKPTDCSGLNCVYGVAQLDKDGNCVCVCNDKYFGPNCDKLNITAVSSSSDPQECNVLACSDEDVVALCPITCKVCGGTTFCKNDGSVDSASCQCNCLPNFTGKNCEIYNP